MGVGSEITISPFLGAGTKRWRYRLEFASRRGRWSRRLARKDARAENRENEVRLIRVGALHRSSKTTEQAAARQRARGASVAAVASSVVAVPPRSGVGATASAASTAASRR